MSAPGRVAVDDRLSQSGWRLRSPFRKILERLADVVCPPQLHAGNLEGELITELESLLGALPSALRRLLPVLLVALDQGARLYPRAYGRRFVQLRDAEADAYVRMVLARRRSGLATSLQRIKALIIMCYFELPAVKEQLGYQPNGYIAEVSRRRLATYGAEIRAREAAP